MCKPSFSPQDNDILIQYDWSLRTRQAADYQRFREQRHIEIEALKHSDASRCDQHGRALTSGCNRGCEKDLLMSPRLRIVSCTMFVKRVLAEQDYQHIKTNADSCAADRLAAKVSRWTMADVDQATLRAHVGIEDSCWNSQGRRFSALVESDEGGSSSTTSSCYFERYWHTPIAVQTTSETLPSRKKEHRAQSRRLALSLTEVLALEPSPQFIAVNQLSARCA